MISKDIDLNFLLNPLTKDLNKKIGTDAVKQSLKTLMLLGLYEKPFNSDLNVNIRGFMFENYLIDADKELKDKIIRIINKYEPRIKIKLVDVVAKPDSNKSDISIEYYYTENKQETLKFSLEETRIRCSSFPLLPECCQEKI